MSIDESHFRRDLDEGNTWSPKGGRAWRVSTTPALSERLNRYGAYDFSRGRCLIWEDGPCDGNATCHFVERVARWRSGLPGYSPDLNPIERLWDRMRDEVTRGHCHSSLKTLRVACHAFIAEINAGPEVIVDRLWPRFELDPEHEAKLRLST